MDLQPMTRTELELTQTLRDYFTACYGQKPIGTIQRQEVRRAFLLGIHWLNTRHNFDPEMSAVIAQMLDIPKR